MITEDTPEVLLWRGDSENHFAGLHYVGGVDISFKKESPDQACAMLVVLSYPDLEVRGLLVTQNNEVLEISNLHRLCLKPPPVSQ